MVSTLIGVDIGGTFTDFIIWQGDDISAFKLLSTPANPAKAVLDGLAILQEKLVGKSITIIHGSTVAYKFSS